MKKGICITCCWLICAIAYSQNYRSQVWVADQGDGTYNNPVLYADYSDPDVCATDDGFYMTASSFNCVPGLPILYSKDLVNWKIIGHALQELTPAEVYDTPQPGKGVYAPSIRYHAGEFYIYWGDPDFGIYMVKTKDPAGKWDSPTLVKAGKGMIDPCPLFDDNGKTWLVHAWAASRSRINGILSISEMNSEGTLVTGKEILAFDGRATENNTVEGPKFYKRNGYYYILAPAGGVKTGWQLALRSKNVLGPYEYKVVLEQGASNVNGPHQGAWVETKKGESWFLHFQDRDAYGRIIHLQPIQWVNDWPEMGIRKNGKQEPVSNHKKPDTGMTSAIENPIESDEFDQPELGLQWQWNANPKDPWYMPTPNGFLRLYAIPTPTDFTNFWEIPNLLLQKFPAESFSATVKLTFTARADNEKTGLIVMGMDYSYIAISKSGDRYKISQTVCKEADKNTPETVTEETAVKENTVYLKVTVGKQALCKFSYSVDGKKFIPFGEDFTARQGRWIGAKVGLFAISPNEMGSLGYSDVDWFRVKSTS